MLDNLLSTYDDGVPMRAAVKVQKCYRGYFVRKFGECDCRWCWVLGG